MITTVTNDSCFEMRGLSTDTKPIGSNCVNSNVDFPISNGSTLFCMDTSEVYMFKVTPSGTNYIGAWVKI